MRVLVLALTVALAAGSQINIAPEFANGKTYVYKYEALLMGGLPEEGLARAGVKIRSKAMLSGAAAGTFILKLVDPEIFEYSGIWPQDTFIPATRLTSALAAQLLTPIKFEYANGVVGKVFAPAGVSVTVLNIYRGILNMLQLNIKKTQNVYELQEPGVQGVCKTHYIISEDAKADRIVLTKTKDMSHCQERITKDIGMAYTKQWTENKRGAVMKGAAAFNYIMKPAETGSLVLEATATEMIEFSPFNILNGAAIMEAKQILTFVEIQKAAVEPTRAEYVHRGSLQYEFGSELLQTPVQLLRISNAEAQIVEVLNHLVTFNAAKVHEDSPLKFIELIQLLRVARYESIEAIWAQFKAKADHRYWIWNAIPAIGTSAALRFIKTKFLAGEATHAEASQALTAAVHLVAADLEAIKITEELALNSKIQATPALREIVLLGYGTLVAKFCAANPTCPAELVRPIHELAVQAVARAEINEVVIALKVLGNAGHPASIKPILKILPGFGSAGANLPLRVQIDAIFALRNIAKKEPKMIQEIAVQLFMDRTLHPELRMAAAIVLFETKLPMGLVAALADALWKETNMQVASFVYSFVKAMTRSTAPDFASVTAACNVAVKILSPKYNRLSYRYSRAIYLDAYHNPWMMGAAFSAFYINDAATVMPKAIVAKARSYFAGVYADVFEVVVRTEGIQEAFMKIPAVPADADRITRMKQVMKALADWRAHPASQPLASLSVKWFGQEVAFANIDKAIVDHIVEMATGPTIHAYGKKALDALLSGIAVRYAKPMLVAEVRRVMPTAVGLPIDVSFYTAAVAAASIDVQATVTPPVAENFHPAQLLKADINMRATIAPSVAMHTYAFMGVNTALVQAAVVSRAKVQTIIPAKVEARIDIAKGNFRLQFLPVQGVDKIASVTSETFAVARNVEDLAAAKITPLIPADIAALKGSRGTFSSSGSLPGSIASSEIISAQLPRNTANKLRAPKAFVKKLCSAFETFGLKACAGIESRNAAFIRDTPLYSIIGKHAAVVEIVPVAGPAVRKIEVELQFGEKAAEKILKVIPISREEELPEDRNVLMKLKKILVPGLSNSTAGLRSSSSSSSQSSSSTASLSSSSSSRSSKSSKSSKSSSRSSSSGSNSKIATADRPKSKSSSSLSSSVGSSSSVSSKRSSASSSRVASKRLTGSSSSVSSKTSSASSSRVASKRLTGSSSSVSSKSSSGSSSRSSSSRSSSSRSSSSRSSSSRSSSSRGSSSGSSSGSSILREEVYDMTFNTNHIHQHAVSTALVGRSSSAYSIETIYREAKYLANTITPAVVIIVRAERADHRVQGYQIAAYLDKATARLQVILASLAEGDRWRICADGVKLSNHKLMAKVAWGIECKQYQTEITAETGAVGQEPAIRLKLTWDKLPKRMVYWAEKISAYFSRTTWQNAATVAKVKNPRNQVKLTVAAASESSLNAVLKTPWRTIWKLGMNIPVSLPLGDTAAELAPYSDSWANKLSYMFTKANAAECTLIKDTVVTFNNRKYKNEMPHSCFQILAQDCTEDLKFRIMLKRDHALEQNFIHAVIANIFVDVYPKDGAIAVKVNGAAVANLPYVHPEGKVQIRQKGAGIVLHAPNYGLQEVFTDFAVLKVKVADWMRGKVCGLCGAADGEFRQEYRLPNQRLTKNATSFAHSWALGAKSCHDAAECYLRHESVKLDKQVLLHGQESKCYSVEPVLRCLPGCLPVRSTPVTIGFHCLPAGSNVNRPEGLSSIYEKSMDLRETTDAHLACRCSPQCA